MLCCCPVLRCAVAAQRYAVLCCAGDVLCCASALAAAGPLNCMPPGAAASSPCRHSAARLLVLPAHLLLPPTHAFHPQLVKDFQASGRLDKQPDFSVDDKVGRIATECVLVVVVVVCGCVVMSGWWWAEELFALRWRCAVALRLLGAAVGTPSLPASRLRCPAACADPGCGGLQGRGAGVRLPPLTDRRLLWNMRFRHGTCATSASSAHAAAGAQIHPPNRHCFD